MKPLSRIAVLLSLLISIAWLDAEVVINEVYYDHPGSDTGYEWIELYNNGTGNEQLEGATLKSAGSTWSITYTFPAFVLRPGRYLLIGEEQVPNAQLYAVLDFENGDTGTDGIRYVSPDGTYTDTVLYCSPNDHALTGDTGIAATHFAPDVAAGSSLARILNGEDTDDCAADFIAETQPSPGTANPVRCDYALLHPTLIWDAGTAELQLYVKNNSSILPQDTAYLNITQNGTELYNCEISPIEPEDSTLVQASFLCSAAPFEIALELAGDNNLGNNSLNLNPVGEAVPSLYINEFLADPESGNQEWLELYQSTVYASGDYRIEDATQGSINFSLPAAIGHYVICTNAASLKARYPDCPANAIVTATSWVNLNNDGDSLVLYCDELALDSLAYNEAEITKGVSRERFVDSDNHVRWRSCYHPSGGTPGRQNSIPPALELPGEGKVAISGSPCKARAGQEISLIYNLNSSANKVSCKVFDMRGNNIRILADNMNCPQSGLIKWDGRRQNGAYAERGVYLILWESQSADGGAAIRKQMSVVISG